MSSTKIAPSLDECLERANAMPTLPEIVQHVMHTLHDDDADTDTLVHHINTDPTIVARLLAAANSSAFGLSSPVDSARQAFIVLGVDRVISIILATTLIQRFDASSHHFSARQLWLHSLGVATCARVLAEETGHSPEAAFTAGLLHDIGQLLMHTAAPEAYQQVQVLRLSGDMNVTEAERSIFGYDHASAGYRLAEIWKLPGSIAEGIAAHHDPDAYYGSRNGSPQTAFSSSGSKDDYGDLTHVSEILSHALDLGKPANNLVPAVSIRACASLGISWSALAPRFPEVEARFDGMRIALGL